MCLVQGHPLTSTLAINIILIVVVPPSLPQYKAPETNLDLPLLITSVPLLLFKENKVLVSLMSTYLRCSWPFPLGPKESLYCNLLQLLGDTDQQVVNTLLTFLGLVMMLGVCL